MLSPIIASKTISSHLHHRGVSFLRVEVIILVSPVSALCTRIFHPIICSYILDNNFIKHSFGIVLAFTFIGILV